MAVALLEVIFLFDLDLQYKAKGDESGLHIIIFDELDAICKQRGSTQGSTGVGDSVANQLLSKVRSRPYNVKCY